MVQGKVYKFKICSQEAFILNKKMEVSVPDSDIGSKILLKVSDAILDGKLLSLQINMLDKIILVSAKDAQNLLVRAEEIKNKSISN